MASCYDTFWFCAIMVFGLAILLYGIGEMDWIALGIAVPWLYLQLCFAVPWLIRRTRRGPRSHLRGTRGGRATLLSYRQLAITPVNRAFGIITLLGGAALVPTTFLLEGAPPWLALAGLVLIVIGGVQHELVRRDHSTFLVLDEEGCEFGTLRVSERVRWDDLSVVQPRHSPVLGVRTGGLPKSLELPISPFDVVAISAVLLAFATRSTLRHQLSSANGPEVVRSIVEDETYAQAILDGLRVIRPGEDELTLGQLRFMLGLPAAVTGFDAEDKRDLRRAIREMERDERREERRVERRVERREERRQRGWFGRS
ncbi:hypothetical protein ACQBAT_04860 [Ornithinimicrobium sp. Y1847]|uniref:hypothetical protein n=1 Tax=Ornithinimicrobium sp. Y1847 TaxID=3405419 RepID=UPI003B676153